MVSDLRQQFPQNIPDLFECEVPRMMTIGIIDGFEAIQIDHDKGRGLVRDPGLRKLSALVDSVLHHLYPAQQSLTRLLVQITTIIQTSERVRDTRLFQL